MNRYEYEGAVTNFGTCVTFKWKGSTTASSLAKAKSNLKYQYCNEHNLRNNTKLEFPGKITQNKITEKGD